MPPETFAPRMKPHVVRLDDGQYVMIAACQGDACEEMGSAPGIDGGESWSCDRLKHHDGAHVAMTFHEESRIGQRSGDPDEIMLVWIGAGAPRADLAPPSVEQMLVFLLTRIGSWTNARWDQHIRERVGDAHADVVIRWLAERGIRPYIPEGIGGRLVQESIR